MTYIENLKQIENFLEHPVWYIRKNFGDIELDHKLAIEIALNHFERQVKIYLDSTEITEDIKKRASDIINTIYAYEKILKTTTIDD